jgi:hypothetical protein
VVSITKRVFADSTKTLVLKRLSLAFVELQTEQSQPIIGMPVLVPVPKN